MPRDDWRAGKLIGENNPIILYPGRVDRRKGALDLLEAFNNLINEIDVKPTLVYSGIGPDFDSVKARIEDLNLQKHVRMLGYVEYENVPEIYKKADVFASPTYAEGFSNTILEAMAAGLPIVSTESVGVIDCLRNGENGWLVAIGNIEELKNALRRVLTDENLRTTLAGNALDEVRRVYSREKIGRQIIEIYERVRLEKPLRDWNFTTEKDDCR